MFAYLLVTAVIASILFTIRGLVNCSWVMMWCAALGSYLASLISGFSIGWAVFLLACLQIAMALVMGGVVPRRSAPLVVLLSVAIWFMLVPFQIYGYPWLGGFGIYSVIGLLALLAAPVLCLRHRIPAVAS